MAVNILTIPDLIVLDASQQVNQAKVELNVRISNWGCSVFDIKTIQRHTNPLT
jgi:hypothetical protein